MIFFKGIVFGTVYLHTITYILMSTQIWVVQTYHWTTVAP